MLGLADLLWPEVELSHILKKCQSPELTLIRLGMEEADREGGLSNLHRGTWEWGRCYAKGKSFRWEREIGRTMELE